MPMDRKAYPSNWEEISRRIRFERAKGKCEMCGAPHGWFRDQHDVLHDPKTWAGLQKLGFSWPAVKIVLTTAHLGIAKLDGTPGSKDDRMDCRDENLAALCQRCHLNFDRPENLKTQLRNRQQRREAVDGLFAYSIQ